MSRLAQHLSQRSTFNIQHPTFSKMSTDLSIGALLKKGSSFVCANSVSYASTSASIVRNCLEWERDGVPFVIQGVSLDTGAGEEIFDRSTDWLEKLASGTGKFSPEDFRVD